MDQIWSVIGQYAFPIVMCILMAWYVKYCEDKHSEELKDIRDMQKSDMEDITRAINNNTLALQHLTDYMQRSDGD